MGKAKAPKLPKAPSAQQLIAQQAQSNRIDQTTPFGSVTYSGPMRSNLSYNLSPQFQALLDAQTAFGANAAQRGNQFLSGTTFNPAVPQDTAAVGRALFDLGASRALPQFQQDRREIQERLNASGNPAFGYDLAPGAVSELTLADRARSNFLSDLALQSQIAATQQRGELLNQDILANQGNAQLAALLGGASPVQVPGLDAFYGPSTIDTIGAAQTEYNAKLQRAQEKQRQRTSFFGGLFDLGTAAMSFYKPAFGMSMAGIRGIGSNLELGI
jgi:hypothetical protein